MSPSTHSPGSILLVTQLNPYSKALTHSVPPGALASLDPFILGEGSQDHAQWCQVTSDKENVASFYEGKDSWGIRVGGQVYLRHLRNTGATQGWFRVRTWAWCPTAVVSCSHGTGIPAPKQLSALPPLGMDLVPSGTQDSPYTRIPFVATHG